MYWLIGMFHFVVMRVWLSVGSYKTIDAEVAVVRFVAKVAAIGPELVVHEFQTV